MTKVDLNKIVSTEAKIQKIDKKLMWEVFQGFANNDPSLENGYNIEAHKPIVTTIFKYFSGDEDFNSQGVVKNNPSLSKGLLVYGDLGVGKSKLFELIQKTGRKIIQRTGNSRMHFRSISCGQFVSNYMLVSKARERHTHLEFKIENYYKGSLYIDDLGIEPLAFNSYELLESVLFERHRNNALTFVTTNLSVSEISSKYGERIGDRLNEMFNFIKWEGKSWRVKK